MKKLSSWLANRWNSYKYRFVPWIVWNLNESTAVSITEQSVVNNICKNELLSNLRLWCEGLEQYASLREDLDLYDRLHAVNQARLLDIAGFSLTRGESRIPGAGTGVFIRRGALNKGSLVCLYPGTVYQPYQSILLQSVRNQFLFRCADGVLVDGKDTAISSTIYRSCGGRDQVGLVKVCDTSWLTPRPVNPLNIGQYVNNSCVGHPANVAYLELDLPHSFPLHLRKFIPNIHFASAAQDGIRQIRVVALVSIREISEGEELFSNYFTVIRKEGK